jgi:integrase
MRRALTAAAVAKIKPPSTGHADYFDKGWPGLCLRVSYGGAKSWDYYFRLHGKLKRITLGRYPSMSLVEARAKWREAKEAAAKGEDPTWQRPTHSDEFGAVALDWLQRDQSTNRSYDDVRKIIEREVLPFLGGRNIGTIKRRDITSLIDKIHDRGAVIYARRVHAHLHRLFRWSVGRGIIDKNPMEDLPKVGEEVERDRVLTDAELKKIWHASTGKAGAVVRLLMLTAARKSEISELRWSEVHKEGIHLTGDRTKNGEARIIPLTKPAAKIISQQPMIQDCAFVFAGRNATTPLNGWSKIKVALDKRSKVQDWRLHDIRRTVATGLQRLGVSLQVVEAILGHTAGSRAGIIKIYQRHTYGDEVRESLELWANQLQKIVK